MKMDDAFNYGLYKQLRPSLTCREHELRSTHTGFITNIGSYDRQYPYSETKYFDFDKFCLHHGKTNLMEREKSNFIREYQLIDDK